MGKQKEKKKNTFEIIIDKFNHVQDDRNGDYIHYTLSEIIFLIFCGSLVGCKSYVEICDFGEMRIEWFRKYLSYKKGIPSHDTLNRVMGILDTKQLEKAFSEITKYEITLNEGSVVSIDGKWISKSATIIEQQTKLKEGGKKAVQMVNVFCKELNACLASVKVGAGKGEICTLDEVFEMLELSACILTMDAGFCYQNVVDKIVSAEADYVLGLKANQKKLFALTKKLFEFESAEKFEDHVRGHGRIEKRTCKVMQIEKLGNKINADEKTMLSEWTELKLLVEVERERKTIATGKMSKEKSYYIASKELTAKKANEIIRDHWGIENNLHWVLDVVFGEDANTNRTKNSAANFSLIRKLAYNKLKSKPKKAVSINRKMRKGLMNINYLNNILGL